MSPDIKAIGKDNVIECLILNSGVHRKSRLISQTLEVVIELMKYNCLSDSAR